MQKWTLACRLAGRRRPSGWPATRGLAITGKSNDPEAPLGALLALSEVSFFGWSKFAWRSLKTGHCFGPAQASEAAAVATQAAIKIWIIGGLSVAWAPDGPRRTATIADIQMAY